MIAMNNTEIFQVLRELTNGFSLGKTSAAQVTFYLLVSRFHPHHVNFLNTVYSILFNRRRSIMGALTKFATITLALVMVVSFSSCYTTFKALQKEEASYQPEYSLQRSAPDSIAESENYSSDYQELLPEPELRYRPSQVVVNNYYFDYGDYIRLVKYRSSFVFTPFYEPYYVDYFYFASDYFWYPAWAYVPPPPGLWIEIGIGIGPVFPPMGPIYCPPPIVVAPPVSPPVVIVTPPGGVTPGTQDKTPPRVGRPPFTRRPTEPPRIGRGGSSEHRGSRGGLIRRPTLPHGGENGSHQQGRRGNFHRDKKPLPGKGNRGGKHERRPIHHRQPKVTRLVSTEPVHPPATIEPPRQSRPVYQPRRTTARSISSSRSSRSSSASRTSRTGSRGSRTAQFIRTVSKAAGTISSLVSHVDHRPSKTHHRSDSGRKSYQKSGSNRSQAKGTGHRSSNSRNRSSSRSRGSIRR